MQITKDQLSDTSIKLTIVGDSAELELVKQTVLQRLASTMKLQGFRQGKAPLELVQRSVDQNQLQQEFLEQAVNDLYVKAIDQQRIRPVAQPSITISKFVPFDDLEVVAEVEAVGEITLPDYAKLKITKPAVDITDEQVDNVMTDLRKQVASREDVDRAAKTGDEVTIDFAGSDPDTKQPLPNTDGKDYPLLLGGGNFIPGFEDELISLKAGDDKTFTITFPADYGVAAMQSKQVSFAVSVKKVQAVVLPKVDKDFAAKVGNFKTVDELTADVRRELVARADQEAERDYDNQLLEAIAKNTKVAIPANLIDDELERLEQQEKQNIVYRGQTWQEHLDSECVTEEEHRQKNREPAELRVKSGLILGEIAEKEQIQVSPEDLEIRIQLLKGQYGNDQRMLAELDKPENRRDILSRMMTEKTLDKLKSLQ